ncbi:hypothetical protein FOL47_009499 [Perkinsus chesapeaki]|uniref:Uncharacterized protein n=1 Tax=Perkinsus chesapeaki TaxID=330153 RepID=A0A7J6L7S8_PERCH|nr:hypothetical protein FOL47_009499 [Perkinsus chesapeaki]
MAGAIALRRSSRLHPQVEDRQLHEGGNDDAISEPRESVTRRASVEGRDKRRRRSSLIGSPGGVSHQKTDSIRSRCRRSSRLGGRRETSVTKFTTPQRLLGQMESPQELSEWWTSDYEACPPYFAHENHPLYDMRYSPPSSEDRHWRRIIRKSTRIRGEAATTAQQFGVEAEQHVQRVLRCRNVPGAEEFNQLALMSLAELERVLDDDENKAATPQGKDKPPTRRQPRGATDQSASRRRCSVNCLFSPGGDGGQEKYSPTTSKSSKIPTMQ